MHHLKNLKHIFFISAICLFLLFGSIVVFSQSFLMPLNYFFIYRTGSGAWQDLIYRQHLAMGHDIAIVQIDEKSLNSLQATGDLRMLTIPKSRYTELVQKLENAGVQGIAFDIIFSNTDPDEETFAHILTKYHNIVIATGNNPDTLCQKDISGEVITCDDTPRSVYGQVPWGLITTDAIASERDISMDLSGKPYLAWKTGSGHVTLSDLRVYTLPIALAMTQSGSEQLLRELGNTSGNTVLNQFLGDGDHYPTASFIDVLDMSDVDARSTFEGKYVFVGESGTRLHDAIISPINGQKIDGVETHAQFLDALLQHKILHHAPMGITFVIYIVLTILMVTVYFFIPDFLSPIVAIVTIVVSIWVSRMLYGTDRILVDIFPLLLASALLTYPITYIYKFFVVDRAKHFIENAFSHYIDPTVVKMIDTEEVSAALGGEKKDVSVMFSDIANFTTISESLEPRDLFLLMTSYLSRMTDILIHEHGTLDKYIGDAVMGFFGAPIADPLHPVHACTAALRMREALPGFNSEIIKQGLSPIDFRIGIASGDVMIGNIGSKDRFNYTVIGDTVNLASRLEATGKEYAAHIIISGSTREQIGEEFLVRELDTIAVKGKNEGVRIYELIGFAKSPIDMQIYTQYESALALYRGGQYLDAGKLWESLMDQDPPSRVMAERCVEILAGRIQVEHGIYRMTHK